MPSDTGAAGALEMLAAPIGQYRSALAATLEEVRGLLTRGRASADARAADLQDQLGRFAGGRIDPARLSSLLGNGGALDASSLQRLERAADTLRTLVSAQDDLFHVIVAPGGDLAASVAGKLASIGRAFAAARIAGAAHRAGGPSGIDEDSALDRFPFALWTVAERNVAPPLVVTVAGSDLNAGALALFLDGAQKILLLVEGAMSPAPLVRLITPGVLVMQACQLTELEAFASWPGAAVAAIVPASAVRFLHDPAGGAESWQRMSILSDIPSRCVRIAGVSAWQQAEELRHLALLSDRPAATPAEASPPLAAADPADHLAAWLLQQANVAPRPGE